MAFAGLLCFTLHPCSLRCNPQVQVQVQVCSSIIQIHIAPAVGSKGHVTVCPEAPTVVSFRKGVNAIYMKFIKARMFIKLINKPRFYLIPFLLLILWLFCWSGMNTVCAIWIHGSTYARGGQGLLALPVLLPMPF